ncbi:hypothetical protein A9R05_39345 (plasmid) [Burkholderia sp. KK1]|nr:hypothetical protein A9R05_39345 [Burkholderia sp. KK1]
MIVFGNVRAFLRMVLALLHEARVHIPVFALLDRAVGLFLNVAFAQILAALVRTFDGIRRFVLHGLLLQDLCA